MADDFMAQQPGSSSFHSVEVSTIDPPTPKFTLVCNEDGDWEGLYKDGCIVTQDHHIRREEYAQIVGKIRPKVIEVMDPEECLAEFPDKLELLEEHGWEIVNR